jgi:eukaryotic-like serine/threonine-protein kinase
MIGKTLGHYEITSQLGKGGMGEVYQAKDQKLGRDVAIKVLPEEFAKDADRVARFQREAKLLASLNHPNIAAIHGLEESSGTNFLVLELIEGETLAVRIKQGPIPVEEALKLALQIAEALEAAHEKGVIHRDLKPANIKVTPEGKVKVLDFGLAKAYAGDRQEVNLSNSPTLSDAATQQGIILGTAAYMSPEQARGKSVDMRADIWAFGCVLYEMLTGHAAFSGRDVTEILAAVIRAEPEWKSLPANLHWRLREILERCLEKDARDRCSGISDARVEIRKVLADPGGVFAQPKAMVERKSRWKSVPWVAAAIVAVIITGLAVWKYKPAEPRRVMRFDYDLPEGQQFLGGIFPLLAISLDGSQFVYTTKSGLCLRSLNDDNPRPIAGSEAGAVDMFFSPDGLWIGYCSPDGLLRKIAVSGGAPVTMAKGVRPFGSRWEADGAIFFTQGGKGICRLPAIGANPELIQKAAEGQTLIRPQLLPGGKAMLYTLGLAPYKVMVRRLDTGESRELFEGDTARYLPTGHIVYALGNNLFAVPFDADRLQVSGSPASVVEGIHRTAGPQYDISDSGTLIYIPQTAAPAQPGSTMVWVSRDGKEDKISEPNLYRNPRISPDGTKVAVSAYIGQNRDIWIADLVHKMTARLTFNSGTDDAPLWTPDGKRIFSNSALEGRAGRLYSRSADGTGREELVPAEDLDFVYPFSWSRDGKNLIVMRGHIFSNLNTDIGMLALEGGRKWRALLGEKHNESQPRISPDGQWMAYTSDESGRSQVYARPFPDVDKGKWQVSAGGGDSPLWSPDGRELFYLNGDAVMKVAVKTDPSFSHETPVALFRGSFVNAVLNSFGNPNFNVWDISPDGKHFLMLKEPASGSSAAAGPKKIKIVVNWFEELKQRVPAK